MSDINEVRERLERACIAGMDSEYVDDVIAMLAEHSRLMGLHADKVNGNADGYWCVTFRMYQDDSDTCVLFVEGDLEPTLDSIGVVPRPFEIISVERRNTKQHRWDMYGERCIDCGDKDWMNDPKCRPMFDTSKAVQP